MVQRFEQPRAGSENSSKKNGMQEDLLQALIHQEYNSFYEKNYKGQKETLSKNEIFQEFLKEFSQKFKNNNNIVERLQQFKATDLKFEDIKNQKFTIAEITNDVSNFSDFFRGEKTEELLLNTSITEIANAIESATTAPLDVLTAVDFTTFLGSNWNGVEAEITRSGAVKTIDDLTHLVKDYFESHKIDIDSLPKYFQSQLTKSLSFSRYDPTEKAVVKASIDQIGQCIQTKFTRSDASQLRDEYKQKFMEGDNEKLNVFSHIQTLTSWKQELEDFMNLHNFSDEEKNIVGSVEVNNQHISSAATKLGRFGDKNSKKLASEDTYATWGENYKKIFNKVMIKQVLHRLQEGQDIVDAQLSKIGEFFNFPGSVNDFFADFKGLSDNELQQFAPQEYARSKSIAEEYKMLGEAFYDQNSGRYHDPSLLVEKEEKRQQLADAEWDMYIVAIASKVSTDHPELPANDIQEVLIKLKNSRFDFSTLTIAEKNLLVRMASRIHMKNVDIHNTVSILGLDAPAYMKFVDDLFDLNKMHATIPTVNGPLEISFKKKDILGKPLKKGVSFKELIQLDNFPIHFEIDASSPEVELFLQETLGSAQSGSNIFYDFKARNGETKITESYKLNVVHKSGEPVYNNVYLSPYGADNFDTEDENLALQRAGALYVYSGDPVSLPGGKREYVLDANGQPVVILPSEQSQYEIHTKPSDKVIHINGGNIPRLCAAFALANMHKDQNRDIPKVLSQLNNFEKSYHDTNKQNEYAVDEFGRPLKSTEVDKLVENTPEQRFLDAFINRIEPKNNKKLTLTPGVRLFVKDHESLSPSRPSGGHMWKQFTFKGFGSAKSGKTVKFAVQGCEYDLGSQEGRVVEFPMEEEYLDRFLEVFGGETYKVTADNPDFRTVADQFVASNTGHDLSVFQKLDQNGDHFAMSGEKITHFATEADTIEGTGGKKRQSILYKVQIKDGRVYVEGDYIQPIKDKDGEILKKSVNGNDQVQVEKMKYKRDMDYATFMIWAAEKGLKPQSAKEAEALKLLQNDDGVSVQGPSRGLHFVSLKARSSFFGSTVSKIKDQLSGIQDDYAANLTEYLVGDKQIYGKIAKFFPKFIVDFSAFQGDYEAGLGDVTFAKIQKAMDDWKNLHHSGVIGNKEKPKDIVEVMMKSDDSNGKLGYKDRIKAAAALLWMLEKGHGPYGRGMKDFPVGSWVKALYGADMHNQFVKFYEKEKAAVVGSADPDRALDKLNRLETKFIVDNIVGGEFEVGLKGKYNLMRFYSRKFAGELGSKAEKYFYSASEAYNEEFKGLEKESFDVILGEIEDNIKGNRINAAVGALKALANNAKNNEHYRKVNMYLTMMMMSGILSRETFQGVRYDLQKIARSSGIVFSTWTADPQMEKKVFAVLNLITNDAFKKPELEPDVMTAIDRSTRMTAFCDSFTKVWGAHQEKIVNFLSYKNRELDNGKPQDLISLAGKVDEYNGKKIPSATKEYLKELKKALQESSTGTDIDDSLRNGVLINHNPFVTSPAIFGLYSRVSEDGREFVGGKQDAKHQRMATGLWKSVASEAKKTFQTPFNAMLERDKLVFYTQKFFSMFGNFFAQKEGQFARILSSIKYNPRALNDKESIIRFFLKGWMRQATRRGVPEELNAALEAYVPFFVKNLGSIDYGIITEALGPDAGAFNSPLSYGTGFERYIDLQKAKKIQNVESRDDWLEHAMQQLEVDYYRKTNESLWEKVTGQYGSSSSDRQIEQPMSAPRVTPENYEAIKKNNINTKISRPIEKTGKDNDIIYADTIEQLPINEADYLRDEYPDAIDLNGDLTEEAYEVLGNRFQKSYQPIANKPRGQRGF